MVHSVELVDVVRSGFIEGRHRGSLVVLHEDGSIAVELGDPHAPIFPRSTNKPMQAAGMVSCGLDIEDHLLALSAASHSGEEFHLEGVRTILTLAGLTEVALATPESLPYGEEVRAEWLRTGRGPSSIAMNCSGKHAAMLATCVIQGWDQRSYCRPDHPLQQAISTLLAEQTDEPVRHVGVDGCGAPVLSSTLIGVARAFRTHVLADPGQPTRRVADAMRAYPEWVGGTNRDVTELMRGIPGLLAKDGAEAVYAASLPDGRAIAFKIDDGGMRARPIVMATVLTRLGIQAEVLEEQSTAPLLGGGAVVGELRASSVLQSL